MEDQAFKIESFCCQNQRCVAYGSFGAGNLTTAGYVNPAARTIRQLRCRTCGQRFSSRKGTVFYRSHLSPAEVVDVLNHVQEGCGMRQTGRLTGHKEDTVIRYARLAGAHARGLHDRLVAFSPRTTELQLDEKWSFVRKKECRCDPGEPADRDAGDCWDHVAYDPEHRLVLDVEAGDRGGPRIVTLLERVKRRLNGRVPRLVTSDAYAAYATVIRRVWQQRPVPAPDRRHTRRARQKLPQATPTPDPALNYATVCKQRRDGRVVSVRTEAVLGTDASVAAALAASAVSRTVNTSFLERHNATDRHRNARKARKTYRFSKDRPTHEAVGSLCTFTYNFCWPVRTLAKRRKGRPARPQTPAMAAGLADHVWTLRQWLACPAKGLSG